MTDQPQERTSELDRLLRVLRRRRWAIVLCVLLATASAVGFSLVQDKQYTATASLLFHDPGIDSSLFRSTSTPNQDPQREAATNLKLVSLPEVASRTATRLGGTLSGGEVRDKVKVEGQGQSDVVAVIATDRRPSFAAALANAFATEFIALRRQADQAAIRRAQNVIRQRLKDVSAPDRPTLQSRADDLKILAALQTGKAELVQPATVPTSPSSPKPVRNGVIGGILGLILGVGLAFLIDRLDRRIKDPREIEDAFRLPVIGAIPESKALRKASTGSENGLIPGPEWEAFRKLRAKLRYFNVDRNVRSVLVTSAAPREGKTTVASNLALAAAIGGQTKVLLLEADLRRPTLANKLDLAPIPGLAELLTHDIRVPEATQRLPVPTWTGGDEDSTLDIIVAGAVPPNPSELLESKKMADLLDRLAATYDLIVVDTPPVSVVSDAMPLVSYVDGVMVVSSVGTSTRHGAHHVRHELESLRAPTLGVVINRVRTGADAYYGYGAEPVDLKRFERVA